MDNIQSLKIIDKIKNQWPQWKTSEVEEQVYCKSLHLFGFLIAKNAIDEHKVSKQGGGLSPKLYHIIEICKSKDVVEKKKYRAVICYFIECIENEDSPHLVGKKIPFYAPSKEEAYRGRLQEKSAEKAVEYCRGGGGTWIPRLINFDISE